MFWLRFILSLLFITLIHTGSALECGATQTKSTGRGSYSEAHVEQLPFVAQQLRTSMELPAVLRTLNTPTLQLRSEQSSEQTPRKNHAPTPSSRPSGSWLSKVSCRYILSFFADPAPAQIRLVLRRLRI